jgi:hypothetical protein
MGDFATCRHTACEADLLLEADGIATHSRSPNLEKP